MTLNSMSTKTDNYRKSLTALEPDEKFSLYDYDQLEYLLECIEAKGWRSHLCTNERGISTCLIVAGGHEFKSDYSEYELNQLEANPSAKESRAEVVLYAYVKALAAQRKIAEGSSWRHFKGDRVDVKCLAVWPGQGHGQIDVHGEWAMEEESDKVVTLCRQEGAWTYPSVEGSQTGDRVFYTHDNKGWARLKDDFLGVVGPKYLEMEGCLRFVEGG